MLYCPDTEEIYHLCVDEIAQGAISVTFRIEPTKNYQKKGVWQAKDFTNPYRIANFGKAISSEKREVSENDETAITKIIADFTAQGIQSCIPYSQYVPFDLVAVMPDMKTMYRVRVGYGSVHREAETDYYAIYDPDDNHVHYIKVDTVPDDVDVISVETGLNVVTQLNGAFAG